MTERSHAKKTENRNKPSREEARDKVPDTNSADGKSIPVEDLNASNDK
jgi:hypothetical protein